MIDLKDIIAIHQEAKNILVEAGRTKDQAEEVKQLCVLLKDFLLIFFLPKPSSCSLNFFQCSQKSLENQITP